MSETRQVICPGSELPAGAMVGARLGRTPIVIVRDRDGSLHALGGRCLHQGGPLAAGRVYPRPLPTDDTGEYDLDESRLVLKCPWHGYEYDVETGAAAFDSGRCLARFRVWEEEGSIVADRSNPRASDERLPEGAERWQST